MSKTYDISKYITNQLPAIRISDDLVVSVNNRKSAVLNVQVFIKEQDALEEGNEEKLNDADAMEKAMSMLLSAKDFKAVVALDLPYPEFKTIWKAVFASALGSELDLEDEKRFQEA